MFEESKAMKELHEIREKIYEETKHMSSKEKVQYFNEKAEKAKQDWKLRKNVLVQDGELKKIKYKLFEMPFIMIDYL